MIKNTVPYIIRTCETGKKYNIATIFTGSNFNLLLLVIMRHQHRIDVDVPCDDKLSSQAGSTQPLDELSRGCDFVDSTTAATNNDLLFVATASIGAIDKSSIAPTSSCCDNLSQQEGSSPPIDKSSIGVATITMTTAAANNDLLFDATGSRVGANDNSAFAPTSPSVDESSPLGGSSPTQDESSREPVVIKLTTAATVDGAAGKSSMAPSNNNSHYQCNLCGDEKILCNKKS